MGAKIEKTEETEDKTPLPLFISFEGVDGVGKSTQVAKLREYLEQQGRTVVVTREPGGTDMGVEIRRILLHGSDVSERAEAMLYAADRAQHVARVIQPALDAGSAVISDRYIDSSLAYQAGGRELTADDILMLSQWATNGLWPVRTYVLDMNPDIAKQRLQHSPDRLESASSEFFKRTRAAFLDIAERNPQRCVVIDATQTIDEVWEQIRADIDFLITITSAKA